MRVLFYCFGIPFLAFLSSSSGSELSASLKDFLELDSLPARLGSWEPHPGCSARTQHHRCGGCPLSGTPPPAAEAACFRGKSLALGISSGCSIAGLLWGINEKLVKIQGIQYSHILLNAILVSDELWYTMAVPLDDKGAEKFLSPSDVVPVLMSHCSTLCACGVAGVNEPPTLPVIQKCTHTIMYST